MKFVDEFRNETYAKKLIKDLQNITKDEISIMEVCGTHTMSIFKYGIRDVLPPNIKLISGPGCPVCVTPQSYIDTAIELSSRKDVITATFGDMMRVPGKHGSLLKRKAEGDDIRVVYSQMEAMILAKENPSKKVIFLSVGFETTTPMTAVTAVEAKKLGINNLFFLTSHKVVPPAMEALVVDKELNLNGFLLPGHVSAIIGEQPYGFLSSDYNIPGVITGFEAIDILQSLVTLATMITNKEAKIINDYKRIVRYSGNPNAMKYIDQTFTKTESRWRGIGVIPDSGYVLNDEYKSFDALKHFQIEMKEYDGSPGCRCGEIMKGKITPLQCPLYKKACTPENPIGSCMVSSEGTCAAYYKYKE